MNNIIDKFLLMLLVIIASFGLSSCVIFNQNPKKIGEINDPVKNIKIELYYIKSDAMTQEMIQIRIYDGTNFQVLGSYERYNFVENAEILNDSTLQLVLRDTSSLHTPADTLWINSSFDLIH